MIMSNDELQQKYDRLFEKVRRMRGYQKEYFKYRVKNDLETAKRFEREVDKIIDDEVKLKKSNQTELFINVK